MGGEEGVGIPKHNAQRVKNKKRKNELNGWGALHPMRHCEPGCRDRHWSQPVSLTPHAQLQQRPSVIARPNTHHNPSPPTRTHRAATATASLKLCDLKHEDKKMVRWSAGWGFRVPSRTPMACFYGPRRIVWCRATATPWTTSSGTWTPTRTRTWRVWRRLWPSPASPQSLSTGATSCACASGLLSGFSASGALQC